MKNKELKRLSRAELLELLLEQTRENEKMQEQLAEAKAALAQRQLQISQAGDLAQAVLIVNRVAEAAQNAADQYLENVKALEKETQEKCERLLREAELQAQQLLEQAKNNQQNG